MCQTVGKKLFLEQEGVRQSMELGLDFRGSRRSGFNRVLEKQLRGRPFRDFQVAAPLKLIAPTSDPVFATLGGLEPRFGRRVHAVCKPCDR